MSGVVTIDAEGIDEVQALLRAMRARADNLGPVLKAIGETLAESTKERFATGTAPDGTAWKPNSPATIAAWLSHHSARGGTAWKPDSLATLVAWLSHHSVRGGWTAGEKRPLIGETRMLSTTITYQVPTPFAVMVGSPMDYAADNQLGTGRIPARPFLGISADDAADIVDMVAQFLMGER